MSNELTPFNIYSTYVVCDSFGIATPIAVSATFWQDLEHQFGNFSGKSLISCFTLERDWDTWEMHPAGDEFVCLLSGDVELILEQESTVNTIRLDEPGSFALVPRGTWHTAKARSPSSMLFVTPGGGTQNKPV
ncbi:cupin domain-containing protein [Leptothermofonsia sp. ETS-13]|uniref:cupin domain-containing protein n=1 Tax=Leptothermofonsia sp. ETS-13 TaxID=3035696 RepID=UPI003B9F5DBF